MNGNKPDHARMKIGILWTKRLQWPLLKKHSVDSDEFQDTYDEYRQAIQSKMVEMEKNGFHVEKVEFELTELLEWCSKNNMPLDGNARSKFASQKLIEMNR
jgi:hypothetical protein